MKKLVNKYLLDERDELLIRLLSKNSRTPTTELAQKLGCTRPTVDTRMRQLKNAGIIESFTIVVKWDKIVDINDI